MDVFAAKLSNTGAVVYATYLGGWGSDFSPKISVDAIGQAHIAGITASTNFPTANAYQPTHGGGFYDVFVTTLNQAGNGLGSRRSWAATIRSSTRPETTGRGRMWRSDPLVRRS
jgi:hypothetical protein